MRMRCLVRKGTRTMVRRPDGEHVEHVTAGDNMFDAPELEFRTAQQGLCYGFRRDGFLLLVPARDVVVSES